MTDRTPTADADLRAELEAKLKEQRAEWGHRLDAIQSDRRRENAPLEADFEEQSVQRENDETLDALDTRGRQALDAIAAALARMGAGSFGECLQCGESIATERLRAEPTAIRCVGCAAAS